jgi:hypothetical protein
VKEIAMWEIFKTAFGLYADVFKAYPLAASTATFLFVLAYFAWTEYNKRGGISPDALWQKPGFILFIGWLIVTPFLGFVFHIISMLKEALSTVLELYARVFRSNVEAAAIVTVAFLVVYVIWKFILKKWGRNIQGVWWHYPAVLLLITWLFITPIVGRVIKWRDSTTPGEVKEQSSKPKAADAENAPKVTK